MPSKLPRRRNGGGLVPASPPSLGQLEPETALILGGAHVLHGATQAAGEVASSALTASGKVLEASITSFGQCFCAYVSVLRERAITQRVLAQEQEITARVVIHEVEKTERVRIWSETVIADAEEETERVRIQAGLVLAAIEDQRKRREAKLAVIQEFMVTHGKWETMLMNALASRGDSMRLDDRALLREHTDLLLRQAMHLRLVIAQLAEKL
jgi:hypothetical protein